MTNPAVGIAEQVRPATAHPGDGPRPRGVLVVDDQEPVRRVLGAGMRSHGLAVWLAADGAEAVELYRRHRDTIDVVLLDVQMPGLDGPAVLAALRAIEPGVRAFFMTGDPGRYGQDELLATGARRVFGKPLDIALVVAELRRGLRVAAPEEPAIARPPAEAGSPTREDMRWLPTDGPPGSNTAAGLRPSAR